MHLDDHSVDQHKKRERSDEFGKTENATRLFGWND